MNIIYGRSGSGKSEYVLKDIKKKLKEDCSKIYIITPEQFSFTAEKNLLSILDEEATLSVEVLSFARMAHRVEQEVVKPDEDKITKSGKAMIVYRAISKKKSELKFLGNSLENVDMIITQITEFKKHNISVEQVKEQVDKTQDPYLKAKLNDMYLMYQELEDKIENKFIDESDSLTILANNLERTHLFDDSIFYIDEFAGFTKQEYEVIRVLNKIAKELYITICTDSLYIKNRPESDIFYDNKQAIQTLCEIEDIDKEKQINLTEMHRFKNKELAHLEKNIFNFPAKTYTNENENIKLYLAENQYEEIEHVAGQIIKLVRDEGYNFKDVAVICNDVEAYSGICKAIFNEYEIPVFIDEDKDINQNLIIKFALSIIEVLAKDFSYEAVFNYLKTGIIPVEDIYGLENYCIKWGITGKKFYNQEWNYEIKTKDNNEFNNGNVGNENNEDCKCNECNEEISKEVLDENINEFDLINYRKQQKLIIEPLLELKANLKSAASTKEMSKYLYEYIVQALTQEDSSLAGKHAIAGQINLTDEIENQNNENTVAELENLEVNNLYTEKASARVANWLDDQENIDAANLIFEILVEIATLFSDEKLTLDEYLKIIKVGLSQKKLGQIPPTQDVVTFGDVNRSKTHKVKAMFIVGLNDGLFPKINTTEGFFSDKDRDELKQNNFELAKGTMEKMYEENFNIYKAFSTAEEKVFLSYSSTDGDGKALRKSLMISKLKKIFPNLKEETQEKDSVLTPKITFTKLLNNIENEEWKEVYKWYKNNEPEKLQNAIEGLRYTNVPQRISEEKINKLYGNVMQTSVSKLESYMQCQYSFFLKYALKLSEKDKFEIKPIDTGTFMHDVIDKFFKTLDNYHINSEGQLAEGKISLEEISKGDEEYPAVLTVRNITEEMIATIVDKIIDEKLQNGGKFMLSNHYKILVQRLKRVVKISLKYIVNSLNNTDFEVLDTEATFDRNSESRYPPITVTTKDGKKVELVGKIDRIDIAKMPDGKYLRIIDYKSSKKNIMFDEVFAGLQLQLLTYVDAASKNENAQPAGALYFNLIEPEINIQNRLVDKEQLEIELARQYKMQGLILGDIDIINAMDNNLKGASLKIPAEITKDGEISKKSKTVTRKQFEDLQKYAITLIREISEEILSGSIALNPYYKVSKKSTPCQYCPYMSICHFDSKFKNNNYRVIENLKKEEVLDKIKK